MTGSADGRRPIVEIAGIDGAGKSSVARAVADRFGWPAHKLSPFSAEFHARLDPIRDQLGQRFVDAARSLALGLCVLQELSVQQGPAVYDRHLESALMWWSVMEISPLPAPLVSELPRPDLVLLLEVDVEVAAQRMLRSRMESPAVQRRFSQRCAGYLRQAAQEKDWVVLDAQQPLARVCEGAVESVSRRLGPPAVPAEQASTSSPRC